MDEFKITPIVGEIKNLNAVILVELMEKNNILTCDIYKDNEHLYTEYIECNQTNITRVILSFDHEGLYNLKWFVNNKLSYENNISVYDMANEIIFVSCDFYEANVNNNNSMWTIMQKELIVHKNIWLFHLGDQAYMDKVYKDSLLYLKNNPKSKDTEEYILNKFVDRYAQTWMPHHNILANVSNYNLWDDHEIVNNALLTDNVSEDEKYVRDIAVKAYQLYQDDMRLEAHHLHLDDMRLDNNLINSYSWFKIVDSTIFFSFERTSHPLDLNFVLKMLNDNLTPFIDRCIICFSGVPIPGPRGKYSKLYQKITNDSLGKKIKDKPIEDTSKFWDINDVKEFYGAMFSWMNNDKQKEVLIVGGDLHFGFHGQIEYNNMIIPIIIASPITNQPTIDRHFASKGYHGSMVIPNSEFIFTTISSKARRCYAKVNLNIFPMKITMEYCKQKYPKNPRLYLKTLWSFK